jgi:GTP cyclohydrolase IA
MANKPTNAQMDQSALDQKKKENLIRELLKAIGEDPTREGLLDTPKRVVKSWKDFFSGYGVDPKKVLGTTFDAEGYDQMILLRDIEMYSHCEHHMVNFNGRVHIAYIPGKRVVGLSKLARLVEVYSRRLQIQERLTDQIADTLWKVLKPRGVAVMVEAKHFCMCARGVGKQNSVMRTTALKGLFKTDSSARNEFLGAIK